MPDTAEILLEELGLGVAPKMATYVRDLTADDLIQASTKAEYGSKPAMSLIKKLRFPHHSLARLIAEGKGHPECSAITGYSIGTIVTYEKDPSFKELVAYYRDQAGQQYLDVHSRLAAVGTMALEILQDRLEDEPEKITTGQLREIINDTFDRSVAPNKAAPGSSAGAGNGQQSPATINIHFGAPAAKLTQEGKGSACLTLDDRPASPQLSKAVGISPMLLELSVNETTSG